MQVSGFSLATISCKSRGVQHIYTQVINIDISVKHHYLVHKRTDTFENNTENVYWF